MILFGIVLLVIGFVFPRLNVLVPVGAVLFGVGLLLLIFQPGYAYY